MNSKTKHTSELPPSTKLIQERQTPPYQYRSAYSSKTRHQITFSGTGRTKQSFKDECDINTIMGRYMKSGQLDHINRALPQYSNLEGIDYQESMYIVAESRTLFAELPAEVRYKFHNDPGQFLDFVHNPENKQEMATMGLLSPEAASLLYPATPTAPPPTATQPTPPASNPQTPNKAGNPPATT